MEDVKNGDVEIEGSVPTLTVDAGPAPTVMVNDDATRAVTELFCPTCGGHFPGGTSHCTEDGGALLPVGFGNDLSGTVLKDKYVLIQLIGSGGFGHVYRATHKLAKAEIAIKVIRDEIRDNVKARRQFLKEARALMRIQSRHAVVVHDVDEDESGRIFIVMEFLRGLDLEDHIKVVSPDNRRLGWQDTARIVIQMCDALEDAHDQGIVHRDLKPGNVMMVKGRGGLPMAKVVDFGIASLAQAGDMDLTTMDSVPRVVGTPSFMSPEQAKGQQVDHRSDLYSLGAMMYRLVCGCRPFNAKTDQGMLIAHVTEDPTSVLIKCPEAQVPPAFDALLMQLLKKNPAERPADAAEVAERLKAMLPAESKVRVEEKSGGSKKIVMIAVAAVLVAAVVGVGVYFLLQQGATPTVAGGAADVVQPGTVQAGQAGAVPTGAVQPGTVQAGQAGAAVAGKSTQPAQQAAALTTPVQGQPAAVKTGTVQQGSATTGAVPTGAVQAVGTEPKPEVKAVGGAETRTVAKPESVQAKKVEAAAKPDNIMPKPENTSATAAQPKPVPTAGKAAEPARETAPKPVEMTKKDKEVLDDLEKKGTGKGQDSKRKKVGSDADSAFDDLDNL